MLRINDKIIETDKEGFLVNAEQWTPEIAIEIARVEQLELSNSHWEVIYAVREFHQKFNTSPPIRALIKFIQTQATTNSPDQSIERPIDSLYLAKLFPKGVAKQSNKLAGLPKPARCI
ncbi:MAG: sulfurtransferase TusE [Gammaproteobacteria bacterium CG22_combo_CG10-13_8_21_14_all_40_8]|nr:MAG: sulfurtransferase TusE [Gammaproteobacteria bacterium CG22_combo_CG10-13_8_21_14_all_40_8]